MSLTIRNFQVVDVFFNVGISKHEAVNKDLEALKNRVIQERLGKHQLIRLKQG